MRAALPTAVAALTLAFGGSLAGFGLAAADTDAPAVPRSTSTSVEATVRGDDRLDGLGCARERQQRSDDEVRSSA